MILQALELRLQDREHAVRVAMGGVVFACPGFAHLFADLANAWRAVRSTRSTFHAIFARVSSSDTSRGNLPHQIHMRAFGAEPLDEGYVGYPTDPTVAEEWKRALEDLSLAADAELPDVKR